MSSFASPRSKADRLGFRPFLNGLSFEHREAVHRALKGAGLRSMVGHRLLSGTHFVLLHESADWLMARRIASQVIRQETGA